MQCITPAIGTLRLSLLACVRYMVLDLKRFTPGEELPAGLLWVAEQIPGLVASADLTEQLARGYFPSYNIPYFPQVLQPTMVVVLHLGQMLM